VDEARRAAVAAVRPGATVDDVHGAATDVLVGGLVALGVLSGDIAEIVSAEAHKPYYPHRTSHWLGLDVHDPGDYVREGTSRVLEPGMVLTVEPGLYFRPGVSENGGYSGIGIRIEDDVLVTPDGCEVLTAGLPTSVDEVEALVGGHP
jgi:Xaa-Pro aminopeptidase